MKKFGNIGMQHISGAIKSLMESIIPYKALQVKREPVQLELFAPEQSIEECKCETCNCK